MRELGLNEKLIVLIGDDGVGKSSIVHTLCTGSEPLNKSSKILDVFPPVPIPQIDHTDSRLFVVADTSAANNPRNKESRDNYITKADVICLVYDLNNEKSLANIEQLWIPYILSLRNDHVPLIILGNKLDLISNPSYEERVDNLMRSRFEIIYNIDCCAKTKLNVDKFYTIAMQVAQYPPLPLFSFINGDLVLSDKYKKVLLKIFFLLDNERVGSINEEQLLRYQKITLPKAELVGMSSLLKTIQNINPNGIKDSRVNYFGFLSLHNFMVEKMEFKTLWTLLRYFGYDNNLDFSISILSSVIGNEISYSNMELNESSKQFLIDWFDRFCDGKDVMEEIYHSEFYDTPIINPLNFSEFIQTEKPIFPISKTDFISYLNMVAWFEYPAAIQFLYTLGYKEEISESIQEYNSDILNSKTFYYCLILSTTPQRKSILNQYKPANIWKANTVQTTYNGNQICVQEISIDLNSKNIEKKRNEWLLKQYSKCDLVILQFTQNQFDSFEKLTSINKMLQDETNNLPNIVLLSSCSDIFPKINKKFEKHVKSYESSVFVRKTMHLSFSHDCEECNIDISKDLCPLIIEPKKRHSSSKLELSSFPYRFKWHIIIGITGSIITIGVLSGFLSFLWPRKSQS